MRSKADNIKNTELASIAQTLMRLMEQIENAKAIERGDLKLNTRIQKLLSLEACNRCYFRAHPKVSFILKIAFILLF